MPTYEYVCDGCGHEFDEWQSFTAEKLTKCPECKKNKLRRLFGSGAAIVFKGSGFYETDYRRTDADKKAEKADKEAAEAKPETKTETKSETPAKTETKTESKPAKGKKADKGMKADKCPICESPMPAPWSEYPEYPFCSKRCRTIDLGRWLGEGYTVSEPLAPRDVSSPGQGEPPR